MAGPWEIDFENVDLGKMLLTVVGTRTDGEDVRTYRLPGVSVDKHDRTLLQIRDDVRDRLRAMYLADVAEEAGIAAMLSGWSTALTDALNATEA